MSEIEVRAPPHSVEAEEYLLSCCLLDGGDTIGRCLQTKLPVAAFYLPANRVIYEILTYLFEGSKTVAIESVIEHLRTTRQLEAVGGVPYLMQVSARIPTTAQASYFIDKVRELYLLRELIKVSVGTVEQCFSYQGGLEEFINSVEQDVFKVLQEGSSLPKIFDVSAQIGDNLPDLPPQLIVGVLREQAMLMFAAPSKANKTWTLFHLAVCIATGTTWWGFPCHESPVLIVEFEVSPEECCHRVDAICKAMNMAVKPGMMNFLCLRGHATAFEQLEPLIVRAARAARAKFVIYDPVYMMLGEREENSNSDMTDLLNHMAQVGVRTSSACAYAQHFAKGDLTDREMMEKAAGAGALSRYPDAIITLSPHKETTDLKPIFSVNMRVRSFVQQEDFVIEYEHPLFRRQGELNPLDLRRPEKRIRATDDEKRRGRKKKFSDQQILSFFPANNQPALGWQAVFNAANKGCGISKSTFAVAQQDLLLDGLIMVTDKHDYRRTEMGDQEAEEFKNRTSGKTAAPEPEHHDESSPFHEPIRLPYKDDDAPTQPPKELPLL